MLQEITLPAGRVIELENLPQGMTKARLKELLIRNNKATEEDFFVPVTEDVDKRRGLGATGEGVDVGQFFKENLDIPAGIAGAVTGAKLAAPTLNPWLIGASAVAGGAVGTFSGSLASDALTGEDLQYQEAVEKALIGAGLDVATLGAARLVKGSYSLGKKALGHTPDETAKMILKKAREGMEAGTPESLQASQRLLQEKGASLSRSQTGQASALERFSEKIGQAGLLSETTYLNKVAETDRVVQEHLKEVMEQTTMRGDASPREMGEAMYDTINAGRLALSDSYGEGLQGIKDSLKDKVVNTSPIRAKLNAYLKKNTVTSVGVEDVVPSGSPFAGKQATQRQVRKTDYSVDPATSKFIKEKMSGILKLPNMKASDVLEIDRMLSAEIRKFGDVNSGMYNSTAQKELGEVVDMLKDSYISTIKQADTTAANQYAALKTDYKTARDNLLPEITQGVIKKAGIKDYDKLGEMLTTQTNASKAREFMKSIDEAYKQIGKRDTLSSEIPYGSAEEVKQVIKQGYLKNIFPEVDSPDFNILLYAKMSEKYNKPRNADMLKAVTGRDYPRVKQLMNLMSEASYKPEGNLGTLFLRGKEYGGAGKLAQAALPTVIGTAAGSFLTAGAGLAAVLATPVFLAKASFNPKVVNKMLAFDKVKFKSPSAMEKAAAVIVDDLIRGMNEYEAAQFRAELENQ
tara:strand:- start:53 stop:2119 length:2067 start_codon:yes stop_codon:yes gene_type:complete